MPFGAALLAHRRIFPIAVAAGMLLALVTLRGGFVLDDYAFVVWLDGAGPKRVTPFNLYEFGSGDRTANFEMVRNGPWPWWTDLDLKVRFFRPLSSVLLWADHALFGHAPLGYHLHALVWYLLLLVGAGFVLRCVLSPRAFALGFLLFAISGAHAEAVGWISARHMLVAAVPAVWGLAAHVYYRERGFRAGRWLRLVGVLIGLAGGEAALGVVLYWVAYEAFAAPEESTWPARARGVSLPLGIGVAYFAAYKVAGYGAAHSDAYFEPSADPARFASAAAVRVPLLLGELLGGTSSELAMVTSLAPFVTAGIVSVVAFAALLRAIWPNVTAADRRSLRWLGIGAVLATLVTVGGYPGSRLLLLPKIGGCALVATIILQVGARLADPALGRATSLALRAGRGFLLALHLLLSPIWFLATVDMLGKMGASAEIDRTLDPVLGSAEPPSGTPAHVFLLAASDPVGGLISVDPGMLHGTFEVVFRAADRPLHRGDRVDLDDISVTVLDTEGRFPTSFEVVFRAISLDDPAVELLVWRDQQLVPVHLAPGERIDVPWTPGPTGFF